MKVKVCKFWNKQEGLCIKGKRCVGPCDDSEMVYGTIKDGQWMNRSISWGRVGIIVAGVMGLLGVAMILVA